jgi:hypothetical protein
MDLFRAIPSSQIDKAGKGLRRRSTVRIPSNVPYVVDNLWEWLRPESMPSRRHAIYASPTAELALANASAPLGDGEHYIACRVVVDPGHIRIAQLSVRDAREHPDIRAIARWVSRQGQAFVALDSARKHRMAPLFMPGLGQDEVECLRDADSLVAEVCHYFKMASTFWGAETTSVASSEGELFFELTDPSVTYRLEPV